MAPSAALRCYDWNDNLRELDAVADLLACSNHSYGEVRGWSSVHLRHLGETYLFWWWNGDEAVDAGEDYLYGKYDGQSQAFDELAYGHPGHSLFVAAGNDRGEGPPEGTWHRAKRKGQWIWSDAPRLENGGREGGYDTLAGSAVSKNTITVGAIEDMTEEPLGPEDIRVTEFSSWGPADDGRVKPDLVANGSRVFSISAAADRGRDAYAQLSGTSMAAPVATGIGALLSELYPRVQKRPIRSDELKACLIHTAMSPEPGPSYRIGWGSIRADRAGDLVAEKSGRLVRGECGASAATWTGRSQPGAPIRLTLVWLDPPGRPNTGGLDDEHSALVNDLELTVTDPAGLVFFPWSLDPRHPAAPASNSGPNHRDNVERVDVAGEAVIAGEWRIRVTGPGATQAFALAVSGLDRLTRGE
jgi:hypothetical protein